MNTETLLQLCEIVGGLCLFLLVIAGVRWLSDPSDDAAAGVSLGFEPRGEATLHPPATWLGEAENGAPVAGPEAASSHHFIVVCSYCHAIYKIADEHGILVAQCGDTLKVSHGICPECQPRVQAQLDRELDRLAPTPNSELQISNPALA